MGKPILRCLVCSTILCIEEIRDPQTEGRCFACMKSELIHYPAPSKEARFRAVHDMDGMDDYLQRAYGS
jgi:hypothetical protein